MDSLILTVQTDHHKCLWVGSQDITSIFSEPPVFLLFLGPDSGYDGTGIQWKENFDSSFTEICEIGR